MSNIEVFKSAISKSGVSNLSNFSCIISAPIGQNDTSRDLQLRIEAVEVTGRNANIVEDLTGGFPTKIVMGSTMNEMPISVILSEDLREKKFFEDWQDKAFGNYRQGSLNQFMYNPKFYKDYVGTVIVNIENEQGDITHTVEYIEAFPAIIGNISYSWESGQTIAKLSVTLIFKRFTNTER